MADLDELRKEIQLDRLALQQTINAGFQSLRDKLDAQHHEVAGLESRLVVVEKEQKVLVGGVATVFTALVGTVVAWFFHGPTK